MTAQELSERLETLERNLVAIRNTFEAIRANDNADTLNGSRIVKLAKDPKVTVKDTGRVKLELKGSTADGEYVIALIHTDSVKTAERIGNALKVA